MKAIVMEEYGDKNVLVEKNIERPNITENQVLVEVHATSINPIDCKVRAGFFKDMIPLEFPIILGCDAAGVVVEVGSKITNFKVGDRVFTRPATTNRGTYAEYLAVDHHLVAKITEEMSFEEAAALPVAGVTAWQCLVDFGKIKEGDKVLIHAGAGGVGVLAIQIAKSFGAYVATTASENNNEFLTSLGADEIINYKKDDFSEVLNGFYLVLDPMGGEIQSKSYKVLKENGKLISIVQPPSEEEAASFNVKAGFIWAEPNGDQLQKLADLYVEGKVKPVISKTFNFSEQSLKEAHELSETSHVRGKIVIEVKKKESEG